MWLTHITSGQVQNYCFRYKLCACLVMFKDLLLNLILAVNYIWVESITCIDLTISLHNRAIYTRKNKTLTLRVNGKKKGLFGFDKRQILNACKVQFLTHIKCYLCKTSLTV